MKPMPHSAKPAYVSNPLGLIEYAWDLLQRAWKQLIVLCALSLVVGAAMNIAVAQNDIAVQVTAIVFYLLFVSYLSWASIKIALSGLRGRPLDLASAWPQNFGEAARLAGTVLLYSVITTGGLMLFIIPGAIWAVRFQYAIYAVVDEDLSGLKAIWRSSNLTKGHYREAAATYLLPLTSIFFLALPGIGWIIYPFVTVVLSLAAYVRYDQLKKLAAGRLAAVPTHPANVLLAGGIVGLFAIFASSVWALVGANFPRL